MARHLDGGRRSGHERRGPDNARAFRTEQARALWLVQLRDTVRVFLDCDGSYTQAAARLHLHKNTVHYRVRKAEELRGRPLAGDRLDVEVSACLTQPRKASG